MEIAICIILIVLLVALFVVNFMKKKKFNTEMGQMREELKNGEKVMTDSGIVGEVVDSYVEEEYKYFVLKTGRGSNSGYVTVHGNSIIYVYGREQQKQAEKKVVVVAPKKTETPNEENKEEK